MKRIKLRKRPECAIQGELVPQNLHRLVRQVVYRQIQRKYPDKPCIYHNLVERLYWNEELF